MVELNKIYNEDCREGLKKLDDNSVDLTVTSPPYDDLRTYKDNEFAWNFDIFKEVAKELWRVTKPGGIVVWVVGDQVVNGGETGTSFKQALHFQELGFKLHDTMIYEKNSSTYPARINSKRYSQVFEYMFVFVKGKIREDIKLIADKRNKWAGWTNWGTKTQYDKEGNKIAQNKNITPTPEFSVRTNIWRYNVSFNDKTGHPAVFPEKLAEDHILSWTVEGDVVLDPFMGSGTTAKMAMLNRRNYIGFEKNKEYFEKSLERIDKYVGQTSSALEDVEVIDEDGNVETTQLGTENDKEFAKKMALLKKFAAQLEDYANTMSLAILKTLKLTFVSRANDKRVEEVLRERGISGYTKEEPVEIESIEKESSGPSTVIDKIEEYKDKNDFLHNCIAVTPDGVVFKERQPIEPEEETIEEPAAPVEEPIYKANIDDKVIETAVERVFEKHGVKWESLSLIEKFILEKNLETPVEKVDDTPQEAVVEKRKRGRPKGSKNKPKPISEETQVEALTNV